MRHSKHHMLHTRRDWNSTIEGREVRRLNAYQINLPSDWHERLHVVTDRIVPPVKPVLEALHDFGTAYQGNEWHDPQTRMPNLIDNMVGYATATRSPEEADQMLDVAASIEAQMGVYGLWKSTRPQY